MTASAAGTATYRARFPALPAAHFRSLAGWTVSSIGLGTYLGKEDAATDGGYEESIAVAREIGDMWTLSLSLNDNELLDSETLPGCKVHYRTPTEGGSSGSPIFTRSWELMAVHHYGGDAVPKLNGNAGTYEANEGTSIHALRAALTAALV